jgi:hypothetical protein
MVGPKRQLALVPPKMMIMVKTAFWRSSGSLSQGTMVFSFEVEEGPCAPVSRR